MPQPVELVTLGFLWVCAVYKKFKILSPQYTQLTLTLLCLAAVIPVVL